MTRLPNRSALAGSVLALGMLGNAANVAAELPRALGDALAKARLPRGAVSLLVTPVDDSKTLASLNTLVARNPASVIKLVTTWTALDVLGPQHRFKTSVHALGPVKDGVLEGDLLIRGGGDPFLVMEDFWKMVGDVRAAGIETIRGDLVIDQSRFAPPTTGPGDFDNEPHRLYNVAPRALVTNFKAIRFHLEPGEKGVHITTTPPLPALRLTSEIRLTKGRCTSKGLRITMRSPSTQPFDEVVFGGRMPTGCKGYSLNRTALDANQYTHGLFGWIWQQWGGTFTGGVREGLAPADSKPVVVHRSRTLNDLVRPLNKWSNNLMSRSLLLAIGATRNPNGATPADGREVLTRHLRKQGLETKRLFVDNGAGLSRDARTDVAMLAGLLRAAWQSPHMSEFVSSLSVVGRDGTTRRRFRRHPAAGRMHLKTGQLDDVIGVAGYVLPKSGRRLAIALLINRKGAHQGPGQKFRDAFLEWAYNQ